MDNNVTVESLDSTSLPHHPEVVIEVAEAALVVAVAEVLVIEEAEVASEIEAEAVSVDVAVEALVIEEAEAEEVDSLIPPTKASSSHLKIDLSNSEPNLNDL